MEPLSNDYVKSVIEAVLFVSDKPVTLDQLKDVLETVAPSEIRVLVDQIKSEYEVGGKGMVVAEIAGGYQMLSAPRYANYIREFFKTRVKEKLSRPALETLAIIAYKQPVSRLDIEVIRGVNSDGVVTHLLTKGLIKIAGRKDIPGRPYIYGTTKQFLEYFGLKSLDDMPKLEDFKTLLESREAQQEEAGKVSEAAAQEATAPIEAPIEQATEEPVDNQFATGSQAPRIAPQEEAKVLTDILDNMTKEASSLVEEPPVSRANDVTALEKVEPESQQPA